MEGELDRVRRESHERLGNKFLDSRYERDCGKLRSRVDRELELR